VFCSSACAGTGIRANYLRGLYSRALRTQSIKAAQDEYNFKLCTDLAFAEKASKQKMHAALGDWIILSEGSRVLENGCGPGRYAGLLGRLGFQVTATDPFEFNTWERIAGQLPVTFRSGVFSEELPFDNASFDHICCLGALLYFDDPQKAMSEMRRVLRPRGRMVLRTVNRANDYTRRTGRKLDPASKNLYTKEELLDLVSRAGFDVRWYTAFGYWPSFATDFYWYIQNCFLAPRALEFIGELLPIERRVNHIIHCIRA
jgi:SAM-dependent methyltransferase